MSLSYWRHTGEPRDRIIALENAYQGDLCGAMSVGARGPFTGSYEPLLFDVKRIPFPAKDREDAALEAFESLCRRGDVAAFIVEPLVLGAGGMLMLNCHLFQICRNCHFCGPATKVLARKRVRQFLNFLCGTPNHDPLTISPFRVMYAGGASADGSEGGVHPGYRFGHDNSCKA